MITIEEFKEHEDQLVAALVEYIERYGLTRSAREAITALAQRDQEEDEVT